MLSKSFIHINGNLCYINYFIYFIRSLRAHLREGVGCTPVHPAVRWGCLTDRWIMEWWNGGENISLRDPWRKLVDESVQTTTARTILREMWYLHSPMLSLQRDNLTSFVLISFHFRRSWHKQYLCRIEETDGRNHTGWRHFDKWSLCNISSPLCSLSHS